MKSTILSFLFFFAFSSMLLGEDRMMNTISGFEASAIRVALNEFEKTGLEITKYNVSVTHEGDNVYIVFHLPEVNHNVRGSNESSPNFQVTLTGPDLKLISSHLVR